MPKKKGKKSKGGGLDELESIVARVEELKVSGEANQIEEDTPGLLEETETKTSKDETRTSEQDFSLSAEDNFRGEHDEETTEERSRVSMDGEDEKKLSRKELKKLQKKVIVFIIVIDTPHGYVVQGVYDTVQIVYVLAQGLGVSCVS